MPWSLLWVMPMLVAGPWRSYELYQPTFERGFVVDGTVSTFKYNHDSSLAWFGDRWFCLWNGNQPPAEGKPGQLNYMSTSSDGRSWTPPVPAFSDAKYAANPIPCPTGTQWQPNLIVVKEELWCLWSQNSRDDYNGCYFSRLRTPSGKWENRRLLWEGDPGPLVESKRWRLFPTQNPVQLRSGRVLAPVTMIGPPAGDAPESMSKSWWGTEKRDSVLITDDGGATWSVSQGAVQPGRTWAQWEPTVWEQADGTVRMFSRNNDNRPPWEGGPRPSQMLLESHSTDGGRTWTPHEAVRLETVASRMHVVSAGGDRALMVHNDWPAGVFVSDRENLALFFTRGSGRNFVAGPGISEGQPVVCYPQMWLRDSAVWVSYSQGLHTRSIRCVRVSPLPDPSRYYLFPRTYWTANPAPVRVGDALRFDGRQRLLTREPVTLGKRGFTLCARLRAQEAGVLLDTRAPRGRSGFVIALTPGEQGGLRPFGFVDSPERNVVPSLGFGTGEWVYVAVSVDLQAGLMTFRVDGRTEQVRFSADKAAPIDGTTGSIGDRRNPTSALRGLTGELRGMALYPAPSLSAAEHAWIAQKLGGPGAWSEATPTAPAMPSVLWLDSADDAATKRSFVTETASGPVLQSEQLDGEAVLRLGAGASAGVDVDENCRDRGDQVELMLRFRPGSAEEAVLCTVGDAESPARVVCRQGQVRLQAAGQDSPCGEASPGRWTELELATAGDKTTVRLHGGPAVTVQHSSTDTWLYLGEGYRSATPRPGSVVVSVSSVRTRVSKANAPATTRQ